MRKILYKLGFITKKQYILPKLLEDYQRHLQKVREKSSFTEASRYLDKYHMSMGLCYYASNYLGIEIQRESWIKDHAGPYGYWAKTPYRLPAHSTVEDIINTMLIRINIMKNILASKG